MSLDNKITEHLKTFANMNKMFRYKGLHEEGRKVDAAAINYICNQLRDKDIHLRHAYIATYYKYVRGEK